jgi:hypothetical protein
LIELKVINTYNQTDGIPIRDNFVNCNDFADTGEGFYTSMPIVDSISLFSTLTKDASDLNLSPGMQFGAERDESPVELPIIPVLPSEASLMLELIQDSPLAATSNRNQGTCSD